MKDVSPKAIMIKKICQENNCFADKVIFRSAEILAYFKKYFPQFRTAEI